MILMESRPGGAGRPGSPAWPGFAAARPASENAGKDPGQAPDLWFDRVIARISYLFEFIDTGGKRAAMLPRGSDHQAQREARCAE